MNTFHNNLRTIQASEGQQWPDTHSHNTEATLSGITYARLIQILAPYSVEYEDGQYVVELVGASTNVLDRRVANQVSVVPINSAGNISQPQVQHLWQDRGFDPDNPLTVDEKAGTLSVAGTVRTWVGNAIKTLTHTT